MRMENHQNHKVESEPDIEKNHHHRHQQQQQQQHRNEVWGTWEELLLACAVNRHGFKDWDAVAMEVQSRTTRLLATAHHCEQKFDDLSRRFADQCNDDVPPSRQNGGAAAISDHVPWLDELRKLRVAELRREVQRSDVSILSLQLEVKRLEEEKTKEKDGKDDKKPDLAVSGELRPENDKTGGEVDEAGPANSEPEERTANNTDKTLPTMGDESDRENQSVNESNSTGSRFEKTGDGDAKAGTGPAPVQTGSLEPDPVLRKGKPVGEESNNGSYDALAKVPTCESVPPSEERKVEEDDNSSELHDSVAHSGEGGTRESSEVQSSASLTRKRKTRRRKEVSGGGGASSPAENDELATVKSEPLVGVLELIKGHEHSSLFERRLESQDTDRYKDLVKQPMDLETIQLRLQKGHYSSCTSAFFRDLLLLFTNATVFFSHDTLESQVGRQLHRLATTEMKNHGQAQSDPIPRKNDSLPPNASLAKPDSLISKNKASGPILVCRKRSSMLAKPSSATFGQKGDQPTFNDKKERPSSDAKPPMKPSSSDTDEEELPKAKEKPVTGARSLRRSYKNLNNNNNKKPSSNSTPKTGSSGNKPSETVKPEKSKAEGGPDKKRNAAADFLKRIKRNTSAEASKGGSGGSGGGGSGGGGGSSSSSKGGGGGNGVKEQKKMVNNGKGDKGKERASRHNNVGGGSGSGDKRNSKNVENNSQSKRSVGRPPKKAAETNAGSAKRGRESSASAGKDKRPKKRSKK
ncbi:lateral signaling target protein 2 homolog isoform X2 [Glycine soja]|uniref:lateral signaling target protein 2 homolog isoform X2 n=1 Tax=Glycine soja TaxID=3848 RepID=UPI00103D892B|nr:lateral signaling target protein 2 homolog isoform X2 [Glycine soja]